MQDRVMREEGDNASRQEWKEKWAVLQGLNSSNGDLTKVSQKYRSACGKTGFKEESFEEAASTWRKVWTKEEKIDYNRGTYLKEGWEFWCCPRKRMKSAVGFVCMTLLE